MLGVMRPFRATADEVDASWSVDSLPRIEGPLTLYLGHGEGGLYEDVMDAIRKRNPGMDLKIRRGPSSALANTIVAEAEAGFIRADVFWSVDSGAIGHVLANTSPRPLPAWVAGCLDPRFQYPLWSPVAGRIRSLPYHTERLTPEQIPKSIMDLPATDLKIAWAPSYGAFQTFITAMRILEGEEATRDWLRAMRERTRSFAGEFNVVMAVSSGEVDLGLANHYYTLRLKQGRPEAPLDLAFTHNDAGCLMNASGVVLFGEGGQGGLFLRHLLSREVQGFLAKEAHEIPLAKGIGLPPGLAGFESISPPKVDLEKLADLRPSLDMLRQTGVL